MHRKRLLTLGWALVFLFLSFPSLAYAYLDPGTGSYVFQLIIAGIVGVGFVIKLYWKRIKAVFTRLTPRSRNVDKDGDQ